MRSIAVVVVMLVALVASACASDEGADAGAADDTTTTTVADTTTTTEATTTTAAETTTTTAAETTTTEAAGIPTEPVVPGADEDVDAIVEAYSVVFDSTTTYEEKAPYVADFEGLEGTVDAYAESGESFGGIEIAADEVGIEGDEARVLYSFLFAGTAAYSDLEGSAVRTEAGWQITRDFFCEIMTLARVGCP